MKSVQLFILIILLFMVSALVPQEDAIAQSESDDMMAMAHYNMKAGDDLSLQLAEEGATPDSKVVQADYDPYHGFPGGRANRRWVDVGTWESETLSQGTFRVNGSAIFNLWVAEIDEGFSNTCDFEFRLDVDGQTVVTATTSTVTSSSQTEIRTNPTGDLQFEVTPQTILSLTIRYSGWEDINVYWDSYDRDSGFRVDMDSIKIISFKAGKTSSSVKFADRFGADWFQSTYASRIFVNGSVVESNSSVVAKGDISDGNGTIPVYEITWTGYTKSGNESVAIGLSYSRIVNPTNRTSWYLEGGSKGGDNGDENEILGMSEDDAKIVLSGVALIIIVLVVFFMILLRKHPSDEEEVDFDGESLTEEEEYGSDDD